jgi:hypothetical protein
MTDFGGSGHCGKVAECELNLGDLECLSGVPTLTATDLTQLGVTTSTCVVSGLLNGSIHGGDVIGSMHGGDVISHAGSVIPCSLTNQSRTKSCHTILSSKSSSQNPGNPSPSSEFHMEQGVVLGTIEDTGQENPRKYRSRHRNSSLVAKFLRTFRPRRSKSDPTGGYSRPSFLETITAGISACSSRSSKNSHRSNSGDSASSTPGNETNSSGVGSGVPSDGESSVGNTSDLIGHHQISNQRRKSHDDRSHDGTNGSDSTSTGYVSDSSNEKHYPKNGKSSLKRSEPVTKSNKNVKNQNEAINQSGANNCASGKSLCAQCNTDVKALSPIKEIPQHNNKNSNALNAPNEPNAPNAPNAQPQLPTSGSEEEVTGSDDSLYTTATESGSSDYETESSEYQSDQRYDQNYESDSKNRKEKLDAIPEVDEPTSKGGSDGNSDGKELPAKPLRPVKRRKSTLRRKRTQKETALLQKAKIVEQPEVMTSSCDHHNDQNNHNDQYNQNNEDAVSRTGSLKDMIYQFEQTGCILDINGTLDAAIAEMKNNENEETSMSLGVKAIAQKIQEAAKLSEEDLDASKLPASQILKLQKSRGVDEPANSINEPQPINLRSESKVKQIAQQLIDEEQRRAQKEIKLSLSGKSPKLTKKQSSASFIKELLEIARVESQTHDRSDGKDEPHDFKQSLLAARKKITHKSETKPLSANQAKMSVKKTSKTGEKGGEAAAAQKEDEGNVEDMLEELEIDPNSSTATMDSLRTASGSDLQEVDPFVREVLDSKHVPEAVKQKIRIECWSLFNDSKTPKGVKQCILSTMLSKAMQNE